MYLKTLGSVICNKTIQNGLTNNQIETTNAKNVQQRDKIHKKTPKKRPSGLRPHIAQTSGSDTSPPAPLPSGVRFCALIVLNPASPGRGEPDAECGCVSDSGSRMQNASVYPIRDTQNGTQHDHRPAQTLPLPQPRPLPGRAHITSEQVQNSPPDGERAAAPERGGG